MEKDTLKKRYPLHNIGKEIRVSVHLRNEGPGSAQNLKIKIEEMEEHRLLNPEIILSTIEPGDFTFTVNIELERNINDLSFVFIVEWNEIDSHTTKSSIFEVRICSQKPDIDWDALYYGQPYALAEAEGDNFVGRTEKVRDLASKMLRTPMEPFYITGQKRVGKTSLAKAAAELAKSKAPENNIHYKYLLWGRISHEDPRATLRELGEEIEEFVIAKAPSEVRPFHGNYDGSLSSILKLSDFMLKVAPKEKFIVILDEFDEIHQELYFYGNLAETFFSNIRAIATTKNIGVFLVGGENMPFIMERQGKKLNKYSRTDLDSFVKDQEWEDFECLIRKPTQNIINWHDDAIVRIYNVTNGNPYFAKYVCGAIVRSAIREKDADITVEEVKLVLDSDISTMGANHFAHLWQDGIFKPLSEREPEIQRRRRTLVAIARCVIADIPITIENIVSKKSSDLLNFSDIGVVVNDFARRHILSEKDGVYEFSLGLFRLWLADVGLNSLMPDALSDDLAASVQAREDEARVTSEEVSALTKRWPTYRGKQIGTDEVRAWLNQVESHQDQRLLFKILKNLRIFTDIDIRGKMKSIQSIINRDLPEFIIRQKSDRRKNILITYVDGNGKSGQYYASLYAEENRIDHGKIVSPEEIDNFIGERSGQSGQIDAIIIVDDIAATGRSLRNNIASFLERNVGAFCGSEKISLYIVTLVATVEADKLIREKLQSIEGIDADFRTCEIVEEKHCAFSEGSMAIWSSDDERGRARSLCMELGSKIYKTNPLGYGGLGLLIIFPNACPNNTLPILHSSGRLLNDKRWEPLFPRSVN